MGATLFGTPGLRSGINMSGLGIVVFVLLVVVVGLVLGRHGRSSQGPSDPNPGDGWGKGPRPPRHPPPDRPPGGIPLDDAAPARARLRGRGRLADKRPARARRPAHEPDRAPVRRGGAVPGTRGAAASAKRVAAFAHKNHTTWVTRQARRRPLGSPAQPPTNDARAASASPARPRARRGNARRAASKGGSFQPAPRGRIASGLDTGWDQSIRRVLTRSRSARRVLSGSTYARGRRLPSSSPRPLRRPHLGASQEWCVPPRRAEAERLWRWSPAASSASLSSALAGLEWPVFEAVGARDGPRVCLLAGVHG